MSSRELPISRLEPWTPPAISPAAKRAGSDVPAHSSMIYYVWTCKSVGADANNMPECNTWNLAYSGAADNPNGTTNLLWAMPRTVTADVRTIAGCFVYVWDGCNPNYQPVAFLRVEFISSYNMDYSFRFTVT